MGKKNFDNTTGVWKTILDRRRIAIDRYKACGADQGITWTDDVFTNNLFHLIEFDEAEQKRKLNALRKENAWLKSEVKRLSTSNSYRIGRIITWPVRMIKKVLRLA